MKCFCYKKERHVHKHCPMWKQHLKEEAKLNLKPKVATHFIMVQWNQYVIEVCMATRSRKEKRKGRTWKGESYEKTRNEMWKRKNYWWIMGYTS